MAYRYHLSSAMCLQGSRFKFRREHRFFWIYRREDSIGGVIIIIIFSSLLSLCNRLGYERPAPHLFEQIPASIRTHKRSLRNYPH
jgi:hypothetical protein